MTPIDRDALARDLEALGLKAIAGALRRDSVSLDRVLRSVKRTRDRFKDLGDSQRAAAVQAVLDRHWGEGT